MSRVSAYAGVDTERGDAACSVDRASNTKEELLEDYNLISERNFGYTEENPNSTKTKSPPKQTGLWGRKLLDNRFKCKIPSSWSQRTIIEEDERKGLLVIHRWVLLHLLSAHCEGQGDCTERVTRGDKCWHVSSTWRRGAAGEHLNHCPH